MTIDEMIEVMQAFKWGEEIEVSYKRQDKWSAISDPDWSWGGGHITTVLNNLSKP